MLIVASPGINILDCIPLEFPFFGNLLEEGAVGYTGEVLDACGLISIDFTTTYVIAVSGDSLNICGHLLVYAGKRGGYYFHVADFHDYPRYMDDQGYHRYLRDNGKRELARLPVHLPNPEGALLYMEDLLSKEWLWLGIPNNCVTFVEEVIAAGGGTWASLSNCPSLSTGIQQFLGRLEAEIFNMYRVPRL